MPELNEVVFKVSAAQLEKRQQWRRQVEEKIARQQLEKGKLSDSVAEAIKASLERGEPIIKVRCVETSEEIDCTDYDW